MVLKPEQSVGSRARWATAARQSTRRRLIKWPGLLHQAVTIVGRSERRQSRAAWPVRKYRLGEEPVATLIASTTAEERLRMMWPLACDAWAAAGRPIPDYERSQTPVRTIRATPRAECD